MDERVSPYAKQDTDCHEICTYLVEKALGREADDTTENLDYYDQEIQRQNGQIHKAVIVETKGEIYKNKYMYLEDVLSENERITMIYGFTAGNATL